MFTSLPVGGFIPHKVFSFGHTVFVFDGPAVFGTSQGCVQIAFSARMKNKHVVALSLEEYLFFR